MTTTAREQADQLKNQEFTQQTGGGGTAEAVALADAAAAESKAKDALTVLAGRKRGSNSSRSLPSGVTRKSPPSNAKSAKWGPPQAENAINASDNAVSEQTPPSPEAAQEDNLNIGDLVGAGFADGIELPGDEDPAEAAPTTPVTKTAVYNRADLKPPTPQEGAQAYLDSKQRKKGPIVRQPALQQSAKDPNKQPSMAESGTGIVNGSVAASEEGANGTQTEEVNQFEQRRENDANAWNKAMAERKTEEAGAAEQPKESETEVQYGGPGSGWSADSMKAGARPEKAAKDPVDYSKEISYGADQGFDGGAGNIVASEKGKSVAGERVRGAVKAVKGRVREAMKPVDYANVTYGKEPQITKEDIVQYQRPLTEGEKQAIIARKRTEQLVGATGDGKRGERARGAAERAEGRVREAAGNVVEKFVRTVEVPEEFPTKAERKAHAEFVKANRNNPEQIQRALEARLSSGDLRLVEETDRKGVVTGYRMIGIGFRQNLAPGEVNDTILGAAARGAHLRNRVAKGEVSSGEQQLGNVKARLEANDAYIKIKRGEVHFYGSDGKKLPITMTPFEAKEQGFLEAYGVSNTQTEAGTAESPAEGAAVPTAEAGETHPSTQVGERAPAAEAAYSEAVEEAAGEVAPEDQEQPAPSVELASPVLEKFSMDRLQEYSVEELNEIITALENSLNKINAGLELVQKMEEENSELEGDPRLAQFVTGLNQLKEAQTKALEKVVERRNELVAEQQEQGEKEAQVEEALARAEEKAEAGQLTMEDVIGLMGEMGGGIGGGEQSFSKMVSWLARVMALMSKIAQSV